MKPLKFSQFGIMSVGYQQYSLEYCFDSIADSGLKYVDFWGGATHYCAFDTPVDKRQTKVQNIRKMLDERNLRMSVFTAEQLCLYPINVASSNPYVRKNSMDIVKRYIEDTKEFGADYYFAQMGYGLFDEDTELARGRAVEALREITEYALKSIILSLILTICAALSILISPASITSPAVFPRVRLKIAFTRATRIFGLNGFDIYSSTPSSNP